MHSQVSVIPELIERHLDEAAFLWQQRQHASIAPDWLLEDLADLDDRLEAHIDGLRIAGDHGWRTTESALDRGAGHVFVAGLLALESGDKERLAGVIRASAREPRLLLALDSAFGHVAPRHLEGIVKSLLGSVSAVGRRLAIAACVSHGVQPGSAIPQAIADSDENVACCGIRAVGALGLVDLAPMLSRIAVPESDERGFWSSWSLVLHGNKGTALDSLAGVSLHPGPHHSAAFCLTLQATTTGGAHKLLQSLAQDPARVRWLIQGSGTAGDPGYIPWLLKQMADLKAGRQAAEAFSLITGVDLKNSKLDRSRPEGFESGPNDDPNDANIDMDPDDGLPWPNVEKIEGWWAANGSRFQKGSRYFMGAPVTRAHCIDVLKNGYQRQRILAAHHLCLLDPGTPLFNTSAPAWRQQRLLAKMT